jgi:hypothetical protein
MTHQFAPQVKPSRAVAQADSHWSPTQAARVRARGICGEQSGIGADFHRVLRFTLPIIPPTAPRSPSSSSSIIKGWYNSPNIVADVPNGLNPPKKLKKVMPIYFHGNYNR